MGESLPLEMLKPQLDKPVTQLGSWPLCAELEASRGRILPQSASAGPVCKEEELNPARPTEVRMLWDLQSASPGS